MNAHTHQGVSHSWTGSGWSNFPKANWENLQDARPPGSVPREADPAAAPSLHSWKSTGSAGAPQMSGCTLDSQLQALIGLSLVQGWRKIVSQKNSLKKMWKISTARVSEPGREVF